MISVVLLTTITIVHSSNILVRLNNPTTIAPITNITNYKNSTLNVSLNDSVSTTNLQNFPKQSSTKKVGYGKVLRFPIAFSYNRINKPPVAATMHNPDDEKSTQELDILKETSTNNKDVGIKQKQTTTKDNQKEQSNKQKFKIRNGKQKFTEYHNTHNEKGNKEYEGTSGSGNVDKKHYEEEDHIEAYSDSEQNSEDHKNDDDGYAEHNIEENTHKGIKYFDHGDYNKGHHTKGEHVIHNLDEFEKLKDFYDENYDDEGVEKNYGFYSMHDHNEGGHEHGNNEKYALFDNIHVKTSDGEKGVGKNRDKSHKKLDTHMSHDAVHEDAENKEINNNHKAWLHGPPNYITWHRQNANNFKQWPTNNEKCKNLNCLQEK